MTRSTPNISNSVLSPELPAQDLARKWAVLLHQRKVRIPASNLNRLAPSKARARRQRSPRENSAAEAVGEVAVEHVGGHEVDNQDKEIPNGAVVEPAAPVELPEVDAEVAVVAEVAAVVVVAVAAVELTEAAAEPLITLAATGTTPASRSRSRSPTSRV